MKRDLPSGTVTLFFTDIEGSTHLLDELGAEKYADALAEHRRIVRDAITARGGCEVDTQGDAFFVAFPTATGALAAAQSAQERLATGPIRVRMGLHTGTPLLGAGGYVGMDVNKGARIAAAGHGGQTLISEDTSKLVDAEMTDLGEHRLKDFAVPIRIFQLGTVRFPPLKTISNTNLPRPASSFVGRQQEVAAVVSLLRGGARLVTLAGPGGSGKTRLAIEAAAELVPEFRAGVFWVALASLRDPALVLHEIARTLGAKVSLSDHIGERELLLVLDNIEQVVDAAPELASLLEGCPNLRLLVTSRELLRVRGEVEYQVLPLAEPEAIELFCARAGTEADQTVRELCRALDYLPLALELAAARAGILSSGQILERISGRLDVLQGGRDVTPRQKTLRATMEWSHELLSPEERRLFARLAVFRGGCTLKAAEEVADAELDSLGSIVDKSLLRLSEGRFQMLETIRDYASEQLDQLGEANELRRRHAQHYLRLAEMAESKLRTSPKEWLDQLEIEHDNERAALDRLPALGETQLALRLAGVMAQFWNMRGHLIEGRGRLTAALDADQRPTADRAKALNGAAILAIEGGDSTKGRTWAQGALVLFRALNDNWGIAYSSMLLGYAMLAEGQFTIAQPLYEDCLRAFRELGDEHYTLVASSHLATIYYELGDRERARDLWEANLQRARVVGDDLIEAGMLGSLADYELDEGKAHEALPFLIESTRIFSDLGEPDEIARNLCRFARYFAADGNPLMAARLLSRSVALCGEIGATYDAPTVDDARTTIRSKLDETAFAEAWEQGRDLTVDEAVALALDA